MTDEKNNIDEEGIGVDDFAKVNFEPFWTEEEMLQAEQDVQENKNLGINRRLAFAYLTKTKGELIAISGENENLMFDALEGLRDSLEGYKAIVNCIESAELRLLTALAVCAEENEIDVREQS